MEGMTFVEWVVGSGLLVWWGFAKDCQSVEVVTCTMRKECDH